MSLTVRSASFTDALTKDADACSSEGNALAELTDRPSSGGERVVSFMSVFVDSGDARVKLGNAHEKIARDGAALTDELDRDPCRDQRVSPSIADPRVSRRFRTSRTR